MAEHPRPGPRRLAAFLAAWAAAIRERARRTAARLSAEHGRAVGDSVVRALGGQVERLRRWVSGGRL